SSCILSLKCGISRIHGRHHVAKKLVTYSVSLSFLVKICEVWSGLSSICLNCQALSEITGSDTESTSLTVLFSAAVVSFLHDVNAARTISPTSIFFILFLVFLMLY